MLFMSTCLLNFYPIIKLDQFELNNYFQSTSYFSSLFNQLSLLSDTAATITAFQHARDVTSPANYLMATHAAITENLFTVATVIITVTMLSYLYKNTSRVAVSFATKITQLFFYLFLIILLQLALALALVENVGELLKVNFFESLLALIVLFLLTILASTDLISIRSFEVPILLYLVACFG